MRMSGIIYIYFFVFMPQIKVDDTCQFDIAGMKSSFYINTLFICSCFSMPFNFSYKFVLRDNYQNFSLNVQTLDTRKRH